MPDETELSSIVSDIKESVSNYWLNYTFTGSPSQLYQVNALASTFMRLSEAAIEEYVSGLAALQAFQNNSNSIALRSMYKAIFHFENSITATHRAIRVYRALRNHGAGVSDPLRLHTSKLKFNFLKDKVANEFKDIRDAIHHLNEKIEKGEILDGQPIALKPITTQALDSFTIGPHEISSTDIVATLKELAAAARHIAEFQPQAKLPQ